MAEGVLEGDTAHVGVIVHNSPPRLVVGLGLPVCFVACSASCFVPGSIVSFLRRHSISKKLIRVSIKS
jgi:hypothetical protein